jgi:CheY-like chemotaxis protein
MPRTPEAETRDDPMNTNTESPCVLIVEDEPDTLDAVAELLEGEGLRARKARHGEEALALLRAGLRPALILLDVKMPVMDGAEFLRRIGADGKLSGIPIAILTASAGVDGLPPRERDAGFFAKPVNFDLLLRVVRQYCA